jgi:hypothetical protein
MISQGPSNGRGIKSFGRGLASMELEATAGRGGPNRSLALIVQSDVEAAKHLWPSSQPMPGNSWPFPSPRPVVAGEPDQAV